MTFVEMKARSGSTTMHGKRLIAESMYVKGKSFLGAAILLRQGMGYEFVVLHLLCQGIEITLKGLLLYKDYNKYINRLKPSKKDTTAFGHDLEKLAEAATSEFGVRPMRHDLVVELKKLNTLYSSHRLRYGTFFDILVNPDTIENRNILRKIAAAIRLADRYVRPNQMQKLG